MSQEKNTINNGEELTRRSLNKNWISNPELVYEDEQEQALDDSMEPTTVNVNDKAEKKRHRKRKPVSESENSTEVKEMWDSIADNSKEGGDDKVKKSKRSKKDDDDDEIAELFRMGKKKSRVEKTASEIAVQVEKVMANLEIAVEDDVSLNKQGKPAISKLMKLPLLNDSLLKIQLQDTFLDHGVLNLLKNWLEPLPDGSLPNINIRAAVLKILNDLRIDLEQDCRREQLSKSGLGTVLMFLSKSDEETTPNKRLARELVNKWSRVIYKSTRYENMYSQEEQEENQRILLKRQNKKEALPKVPERKIRYFHTELDFDQKRNLKIKTSKEMERVRIPQAMSMDFTIHPREVKVDKKLRALAKFQTDDSSVHENIMDKLKRKKALRRKGMHFVKISATRAP